MPTRSLVAVGGGGLIAGIASWFRGDVRVVGVEPEGCPTLHAALGGRRARRRGGGRDRGRLARPAPCRRDRVRRRVAHGSIGWCWCPTRRSARRSAGCGVTSHLVAEPGGAASLAALVAGAYRPSPGERVVVVVCGANTDPGHRSLRRTSRPAPVRWAPHGVGTRDPDVLARTLAFEREVVASVSTRLVPFTWGTAYLNDGYPERWDSNFLWVDAEQRRRRDRPARMSSSRRPIACSGRRG